ncbi:uncharacterized protein LOC115929512 [Strongylocentrotus purpuratus]|uniref:Integrase catalytic domain-containing protein n=1 Tax=Strongylocentrotus purpuratus TaxID=7668 RepID=A0A7M7T534_STRPU|nr:uncharacterized protein LOC115929512 [Strongylocentrotus purpuratus]
MAAPRESPESMNGTTDHISAAAGNMIDPMIICMQQQNQLMQMLVQCNMRASLPSPQVKPFCGNPLEYRSFIKSFEHAVESKTADNTDRLYYLDQYTRGEANSIVKSCMYGPSEAGYLKAKELLRKKFGDKHKIMEAMMNKASQWPEIKSEDGEELHKYSTFITELHNMAIDLNMEMEVNHTQNVKMVIGRLPFKLRDKWRYKADDIVEERQRRITFGDVQAFIAKQTRIMTNPAYGDLKYTQSQSQGRTPGRLGKSAAPHKASLNTAMRQDTKTSGNGQESAHTASNDTTMKVGIMEGGKEICTFCNDESHQIEECKMLSSQPYDDRITFCKKTGLCFSCLKKARHIAKDCRRKLKCSKCNRLHPTALHRDWKGNSKSNSQDSNNADRQHVRLQPQEAEASFTPSVVTQINNHENDDGNVDDGQQATARNIKCSYIDSRAESADVLPGIVPVLIRSQDTQVQLKTYALIDSGSNAVFCTDELARDLKVKGKKMNIHMSTMTDEKVVSSHIISNLEITDLHGQNSINLPEVYAREQIPVSEDDIPREGDLVKWPYLQDIQLPTSDEDVHVGLLIGSNIPRAMEPVEVINSEVPNGPFACKTALGWIVYGATKDQAKQHTIHSHRVKAKTNIDQQLESLFNQDFNERIINDKQEKSQEDLSFIKKVEKSIKQQDDGHFEIGLPMKREEVKLPNNRSQATQRAAHLKKRFERQPDFRQDYTEFVTKMQNKGYMERVPEHETKRDDGRVWYLPHHGVVHPQKKKLRVVFDCSAEFGVFCLNRELLQGPDLTNTLFGVLTRFRQDKVALMADIEGMFSQVRVPKDDRDLLRFLWWEKGDIEQPLTDHRMKVHVFGAVSSPSCANFALKRAAQEQADSFSNEVTSTIQKNFYVDDCLFSTPSVQRAVKLATDVTAACEGRGFHLTKWVCNEPEVMKTIPEKEKAKSVQDLSLDNKNQVTERALGIIWSTSEDTFGVKIDLKAKPLTRRGILSTVSSVFDPLGCVSPVVLPAKQLLQTLCRSQLGWDAEIPSELMRKWLQWRTELPKLMQFKMERCLKPDGFAPQSVTLHHFSDASEKGYGVVSYLRWENEDEVRMKFLTSKARVAPLKEVSIPRMELTAANVAVRIDHMIKQELDIPIEETYFWTDSQTVLGYINNSTARYKTFVANRLAVIRDGSKPSQWRYVESSLNPADICSRGITVDKFLELEYWKDGPAFLRHPEKEWLATSEVPHCKLIDELEVKKSCLATEVTPEKEVPNHTHEVIHHYSDWIRMKRAVCWLRRFIRWITLKSEAKDVSEGDSLKGRITLQEMDAAEMVILKFVQKENFAQEIKCLESKDPSGVQRGRQKPGVKKTSPIYKLDPVLDEGLLRVGGRLQKSSLPDNAKHQVILPKKGHVSKLILENLHKMSGHMGRNYMLSSLHQKYWMPSANAAIRRMISSCISCRRHRAKIMQQKMADLPADRVRPDEPPFTKVGIDYFGPLVVKRGRSEVKTYGVMFTCLAIRAIHIEKAESLSTDSCIAAIRRFIARRGTVKEMRSDNGTNLIGAQRELKREIENWNQAQISDAMLQRNIQWTFNPPGGSHHGGVWERQIRTVRQVLFNLVRQQRLDDEGLQTFLCEAEGIINGRPITKASNDPNDLEALTPNHLLLMKSQPALPPTITRETDIYVRRRWRQVQYMSDLFWRRWTKEYLPQLQQRQKWVEPHRNLQVDDLVLVVDQTIPRNSWLLGRVTRVLPDAEGLVRRAEVKTKLGVYLRPISKLCFILEGDA